MYNYVFSILLLSCRDHALFWSDVQLGAIYAVLENGSSPRQVMDISGGVAGSHNKKLFTC